MGVEDLESWVSGQFAGAAHRLQVRLGGWADGEDAVQEALVRAWLSTERGSPIGSLAPWITTVAHNAGLDELRRRRREEAALRRAALYAQSPVVDADRFSRLDEVAEAVKALPPRQAQVLVLHYYSDLSVADIAARLGISVSTVKSTLHRARATLATVLPHPTRDRSTRMNGWTIAGSHPADYSFDKTTESVGGKAIARLRCTADSPQGFGTAMQNIAADEYVGCRIRFAGSLRGGDVGGWAALWLRIDGPAGVEAFDNMQDRAVRGSTGWMSVEIVLDVVPQARGIAFGVLLSGAGAVDISGLTFEKVGTDVPTTGPTITEPVNLDFSG
ncbi:RNA polymerase sigma factor (sigma-70 family) [Rhodococcus sp. OK611]|uniref:RNA polymerase sigma factor n=1 Tax=unclassified Rhodococcus (in: high G+C Gram-positive bacteria) TaxID=192944 RepID=UPI000BD107BC|nr:MULTISPECIES: RNA polymerase sigma factor [unclassified Rhodococcus (in: high G+C Gram-positive bacteria)]PTR44755.1 RNA polymerase sigma factor (sigma-70 family) [Rhodococcus sp. OK611]SNX90196.1 RNA polymerase sigma factor, sigma-70 family [Rhodococcus sp. OK270]